MKIRPRNYITYAATGVKFSSANAGGANWRQLVFNNYRQHLLDLLAAYGEGDDYGNWLNEMLHRHSNIYNLAQKNGNWEDIAYENEEVGRYQHDYKGDLRFGTVLIKPENRYDFNQTGIKTNQSTRYNIINPPTRTSGDFSREGYDYKVDNLYSAITDDRRLLGRKGDWDENSEEFKLWQKDLNSKGWETYLDDSDGYYKLRRLPNSGIQLSQEKPSSNPVKQTGVPTGHEDKYGFDWNKIKEVGAKIFGNPDLYALGRLAGNLANNDRVYGEYLKGINPDLSSSYYTHRQVVGDEATKQAYYRRAVQGLTRAARPFTSDADRQIAYLMEAKRVGDELRSQGDLADNQEIRRTSDESNLHEWANIARDNLVANMNRSAINKANAAKHELLALKHSAQWSSIDNFLKGVEYRKRQLLAEDQAIDDLIFTLLEKLRLSDNPDYLTAYLKLENAIKKHTDSNTGVTDWKHKDILDAKKELNNILNQLAIKSLQRSREYKRKRNLVNFVKSGSKVTYKKKDDLLYKSTRDVVEHFRKMSKISSDANTRRRKPKPEKLISHPTGKTRKYLYGGTAPFTVYTPVALGGESSSLVSSSSSSSKKGSDKNETLDMIKELFKLVAGKGLPSDVNSLYISMLNFLSRAQAFGEDISTEDIASMYLSNMQRLNQILYLKANYDNAEKAAIANDAINEFAVDFAGRLVGLNKEGEIKFATSLADAKEKGINPLTNGQLLQLRATAPSLAGHQELDSIVANGIGMSKIAEFLKSQLPKLGTTTSDNTIEGYTKKDSLDIILGLLLLKEAPGGDYKFTKQTLTESLQKQANKAILYLAGILPNNMKAVLNTRAELGGQSISDIIGSLVASGMNEKIKLSLEFDAVTGKAAKDANGNNTGSENDMIPAIAFFNGMGERESFIIQDKTSDGLKINTISAPITYKGSNTGSITFDKLASSDFGGQLNMNLATMGDSLISSTGRQNIIIDGRIYLTELPIDKQAKQLGIIKPDLKFLKNIETADAKLKSMGIDKNDPNNIATVNKIYQENNLPILYTISNNKPTITSDYARFAIVNGIGTEEAFGDNPEFNNGILKVTSDKERDQFESLMQQQNGLSKYKLDNGFSFFGLGTWGETELYKGVIYIPMVTSNISALGGTGYKAKGSEYNEIERLLLEADSARELGFKPAGNASNLNK